MGYWDTMEQLKRIILATIATSVLAFYSAMALADHGSIGFGIGTASPSITQTGITLPVGMWAGGLITSSVLIVPRTPHPGMRWQVT
jgi:hypothetical protein